VSVADVKVERPANLDDACRALAGAGRGTCVLAGGTDLMVDLQTGRTQPMRVVDVSRLRELRYVRDEAAGLRIGSFVTCTDLLRNETVAARAPLLAVVAREFAAPQIRNRATIGGNLGTASPSGDLAPALLALDAVVRLRSVRGSRDVPAREFFTGYRRHAGTADELIESVFVPTDGRFRSAWRKVGTRAAQSIAKVVVATSVRLDGEVVAEVRAAAGAVADRTVLLPAVGELVGRRPTASAIAAAAAAAARRDCAPIDDVRSTARYRRHVLQRVLADMLERLTQEE